MFKVILLILTVLSLNSCLIVSEVNNLELKTIEGINKVEISWDFPRSRSHSHVEIFYTLWDREKEIIDSYKVYNENSITISNLLFNRKLNFTVQAVNKKGKKSKGIVERVKCIAISNLPDKINVISYKYKEDVVTFRIDPVNEIVEEIKVYISNGKKSSELIDKKEIGKDYIKLYGLDIENIKTFLFYGISYSGKRSRKLEVKNKYWKSIWEKEFSHIIEIKDVDTFNKLLEEKSIRYVPYDEHPLIHAINDRNWDDIKFLLSTDLIHNKVYDQLSHWGTTILSKAITDGDIELAEFLISNGYKFTIAGHNQSSYGDFLTAISEKQYDLVKLMLEHGANPNARRDGRLAFSPDVAYYTMLNLAEEYGNEVIYNLLIDYGADPLVPSCNYGQMLFYEDDYKTGGSSISRWRTKSAIPLHDDINLKYVDAIKYMPRFLASCEVDTNVYSSKEFKGNMKYIIKKGETFAVMTLGYRDFYKDKTKVAYIVSENDEKGWVSVQNIVFIR